MMKFRSLDSNLIHEVSLWMNGIFMVQIINRVFLTVETGVRIVDGHWVVGIETTAYGAKRSTVTEDSA